MTTKTRVVVYDRMQQGYVYDCVEQPGQNFDAEFNPDLSPAKMLELGVFGGIYLRDCRDEFPQEWFINASFAAGNQRDSTINYFRMDASMPLSHWKARGWLSPEDPRGWFQWYCRYYLGRRLAQEDKRQIRRWKAIARHRGAIVKNCEPGDCSCRRRQRQALLHWAYDSRFI